VLEKIGEYWADMTVAEKADILQAICDAVYVESPSATVVGIRPRAFVPEPAHGLRGRNLPGSRS
jgi:hypothetical protein